MESNSYQGMPMKGGGQAYKEACTALKSQLVKGRIFNDSQGRQLTILDVPKDKKPIEVEVTNKSSKPYEKHGKAKIHMWQPSTKKPCTIMVSMFAGADYVFVKTVMEKFIKLFIDAIISNPDDDPLKKYKVETQEKTVLVELSEKCDECGQVCKGNRGLRIHIGRMHGANKTNEDKKIKFDNDDNLTLKDKALKEPINQSQYHQNNNKSSVRKVVKNVSAQCSECDLKISAKDGKELILKTIKHKAECSMKPIVIDSKKDCEIIPSSPTQKE